MKKIKTNQEGFTFVEALVGMSITAVVLVGVIASQVGTYKATEKNKDIIFAQNKATQMVEELRSVVRKGESDLNSLDTYDNKNGFSPVLTTDAIQGGTADIQALAQLSSNKKTNAGNWKFVRQVKIRKSKDSPKSRTVIVSVYYADSDGNAINPPLATLSTLMSTAFGGNLPTQVIDSYGIALHNQPGWWSSIAKLKQTIQDSSYDLKVKNPGLDYRFHFITKSSFGRDPYYTPYINKANPTETDSNIRFPYTYNGKVRDVSTATVSDAYYYNPNEMITDGMRLNVDNSAIYNSWYEAQGIGSVNTVGSGTVNANPFAYSAADEFNTAVRGPEDEAINEKLKQAYKNTPEKYEPTYRKLIDDMFASDTDSPIHRNLMITNLHGELFPTIPLRNYSDAAKDPAGTEQMHSFGIVAGTTTIVPIVPTTTTYSKYKRVVTHPEQLEYNLDPNYDRKVYLRVYPYLSDPTVTNVDQAGVDKIDTISLFIPTNNFVGSSTTSTIGQQMDNLPNFPINSANISDIVNNIKIQYIDSDYVKRTNNYVGYVTISNPVNSGNSITSFYPIGSTITLAGHKFRIVAQGVSGAENYDNSVFLDNISHLSNTYKIVSCDLDQVEALTAPNITSQINLPVDNSYSKNTSATNWKVNVTVGAPLSVVYEGSYEIIVNPAFDKMATNSKALVPGILIKLHGTSTKNTMRTLASNNNIPTGGIPSSSRLYGLDYIPAPLATGMRYASGNNRTALGSKPYPFKDNPDPVTDTFFDYFTGKNAGTTTNDPYQGSTTPNPYGNTYGAYTGLIGKDLDSWGVNAKNTARWIISINVGKTTDTNTTNILHNFQNKMMAIETRIGSNLNTGMSMNQSPNPYDGTINQVALSSNNPNGYVTINDLTGGATNGTYICSGSPDCGASSTATNTGSLSVANKNNLSNLSRTYVWIGDPAQSKIKETERYQMIGDIRHNPYIDVLEKNRANNNFNIASDTTGSASSLNLTEYPLLDKVSSTATLGYTRTTYDITRFFEIFKKSLLHTNSIYNSLMGFSFYYYGVGGEVGSNSKSINFNIKGIQYNKNYLATIGENPDGTIPNDVYNEILTVTPTSTSPYIGGPQMIGNNDKSWVCLPWIGELYPDDKFLSYSTTVSSPPTTDAAIAITTGWANLGNLPSAVTGLPNASSTFYARYNYGTKFQNLSPDPTNPTTPTPPLAYIAGQLPLKRLAENGSKMFFHGSADGATGSFNSYFTDKPIPVTVGSLTSTGRDLVANYGLIMPDTIKVPRAFNFTGSEPTSPLWNMYGNGARNDQYSNLNLLADIGPTTDFQNNINTAAFYDAEVTKHPDMAGSAPVMIDASRWKPSGRNKAYVIINGLDSQGVESGTIIGRYSLISMLHTYFRTGNISASADTTVTKNRSIMVERTVFQDNSNVINPPTGTPLTPRDGTEVKPSDYPSGIAIVWKTSWKKWDGTPYSNDYQDLFWKELNITVKYIGMASIDNGKTWTYLQNDGNVSTTPATPGIYDVNMPSNFLLATITPTQFSSTVNEVKTDNITMKIAPFAGKDVLFRIEGHRFDTSGGTDKLIPTNYSYQQRTVTVSGL